MPRPTLEVADIFRQHGPAYRQAHRLALHQHRLMQAIETCRTPLLGSVVEWCDHCQYTHIQHRSCRNRHCPKCQGQARVKWLQQRTAELLPVEYFHVVFTIPEQLAAIAFQNKEVVYDILFRTTAETLLTIARDPKHLGAQEEMEKAAKIRQSVEKDLTPLQKQALDHINQEEQDVFKADIAADGSGLYDAIVHWLADADSMKTAATEEKSLDSWILS